MVLYLCNVVKRVQGSLLYCCCNSELFRCLKPRFTENFIVLSKEVNLVTQDFCNLDGNIREHFNS